MGRGKGNYCIIFVFRFEGKHGLMDDVIAKRYSGNDNGRESDEERWIEREKRVPKRILIDVDMDQGRGNRSMQHIFSLFFFFFFFFLFVRG